MAGVGLAGLMGLCAASAAAAADHSFLPESGRAVDGGRSLEVVIAQAEIKSNINESNITAATGGGLLPALIDAKINSDRAKRAEVEIQPLRAALTGFDVDGLAIQTTQGALAKADWFQAKPATLSRDSSITGESGALDASPTGQMAIFEYSYDTSPDFASIRVALRMQLANKAVSQGDKPESRLKPRNLAYSQKIVVVVSLPSASKDAVQNAGRWSADNGKLARQALTAAFGRLGDLTPRTLALSQADLKAMGGHDKKYIVMGGFGGRIQEQTASDTVLFDGGLIDVQTLAD
jgi:hypothetical protein